MERTGRVKLISPAKIGGRHYGVGATPDVTPAIALQLAEMGAIEATASEIEKMRAILDVAGNAVEAIDPIFQLMKGETADSLKTDAGNWSGAKIGTALGRKVSASEMEAAEKLLELATE